MFPIFSELDKYFSIYSKAGQIISKRCQNFENYERLKCNPYIKVEMF